MRFAKAVSSPLFLVRAVLGMLMALYLLVMIASHSVPLSLALEVPLDYVGFFAGAAMLVAGGRRILDIDISNIGGRWILHLAFAAAAGAAIYFAFTGNIQIDTCSQGATPCPKFDHWRVSSGHYYRQDSQVDGEPWDEISRPEYVAEVGTRLRSDAQFSIFGLCAAWLISEGLSAKRRD